MVMAIGYEWMFKIFLFFYLHKYEFSTFMGYVFEDSS